MIVDDVDAIRDVYSSYLQSKGFAVIIAKNGKEAFELAQKERPDIILMDINMPVMDGLEATRHIRADDRIANIPIIALTASAMYDDNFNDRKRCMDAGADNYMTKPVALKDLFEAIKTLLNLN